MKPAWLALLLASTSIGCGELPRDGTGITSAPLTTGEECLDRDGQTWVIDSFAFDPATGTCIIQLKPVTVECKRRFDPEMYCETIRFSYAAAAVFP